MASGVLEVFAGVKRDPDFGLVLAFGAGGVLIEAFDDVALRPLPLREGDAAAMIAETRAATVLAGFRGRPPGDVAALARCLESLADFAWAERDSLDEQKSTRLNSSHTVISYAVFCLKKKKK